MSGVVGWVDFARDLRTQVGVLRAMTETMRNRGPDGTAHWASQSAALGHARLAVRNVEGGGQPSLMETGGAVAVVSYVGEIYNLGELKRELDAHGVRFKSGSDVEILLHSFLFWGDPFVERLDGMFAIAIWDGRARRLLLARDHFGLKPLYYFEDPDGLLFASEPKGIMANRLFEARLDIAALPILLQPRLTLPGETPLHGLREVPPAHVVSYSQSGLSLRRYWKLTSAPHTESFEDTSRHVRSLLEDAVGRQLVADVPRGAMLSGGVDSTSVAALALKSLRSQNPDDTLDTFCVRFDSDPKHFVPTELRPEIDAPYAAKAGAFFGSRHHTLVAATRDLFDVVPATRRARDLPGWGQFDASMYLLFREMRGHCRVALTGEAADEIFGGYPYFFKPDVLRREDFPWLGDGPKLSDYVSPDVKRQLDPREDERSRYLRLISDVPRLEGEDAENARMREVFYLGMAGPLAVILDRKDRMSMALGLEVRVPFCDKKLVEYVWNVPWTMKSKGGVKGLLKAAMADLLPLDTLNRKKSAYPHVQNPEYDQALVDEAMRLVGEERSSIAGLFDTARLKSLIGTLACDGASANQKVSFPGGANPAYMLIHIVELGRWVDDYRVSVR
jgi:asparagine synthase (glutamine-hydrolysing)/putative beta-lactam synthetase